MAVRPGQSRRCQRSGASPARCCGRWGVVDDADLVDCALGKDLEGMCPREWS